jgi:signal peptidase II
MPKSSISQSGVQKLPSHPPNTTDQASHSSALLSVKAHLFLWFTAAIGLFADIASKQWAIKTIGIPPDMPNDNAVTLKPIVIIENYLTFSTVHNTGAVAGIAAGKTTFLILISSLALIFLFWLFATSPANKRFTHIALGMLFAGALGNMYDRIFNQGKVIDFIEVDLHFAPFNPWPTFNVADILLCIGVAILILSILIKPKSHPK